MTQSYIKYLNWEETDFTWDTLDKWWEEVYILVEIARKVGGSSPGYEDWVKNNPWDVSRRQVGEEKTDKFIKIVCKVNGLKYEEVIETNPKIKVTVEHLQKTFETYKVEVKFLK
jgi:hypothetical protein